jgi:nucleoporin NDC1
LLVVGFVLSVIFYADHILTDMVRITALKDGVARIVRTFGDKLLAFKFPPRTARKLQGFIDYN